MEEMSLDAKANIIQCVRRHYFGGVVERFRKPEAHTNAPHRHNTQQTMAIEAHDGQAAATWHMAQEAAASLRITAVVCVRGGKIAA